MYSSFEVRMRMQIAASVGSSSRTDDIALATLDHKAPAVFAALGVEGRADHDALLVDDDGSEDALVARYPLEGLLDLDGGHRGRAVPLLR